MTTETLLWTLIQNDITVVGGVVREKQMLKKHETAYRTGQGLAYFFKLPLWMIDGCELDVSASRLETELIAPRATIALVKLGTVQIV